jgi:hypothetical protein
MEVGTRSETAAAWIGAVISDALLQGANYRAAEFVPRYRHRKLTLNISNVKKVEPFRRRFDGMVRHYFLVNHVRQSTLRSMLIPANVGRS